VSFILHLGVSLALFAGQIGIPFMPTRAQSGSDMLKYNRVLKASLVLSVRLSVINECELAIGRDFTWLLF
jgi:hypothetical protein